MLGESEDPKKYKKDYHYQVVEIVRKDGYEMGSP